MGIRTADIRKPGIVVNLGICRREADIASTILDMDLERENYGWFVKDGLAIALKTIRSGEPNLSLEITGLNMSRSFFDKTKSSFELEDIEVPGNTPSVAVPHGKFIIGDALSFISRRNGLEVTLFGSNISYRAGDVLQDDYETIRENSYCVVTKANLPLKLGLVAQADLINIEPVVFLPAD